MFSKIIFNFDEAGKAARKPIRLAAAQCNALFFQLYSVTAFNYSAVQICRSCGNLEEDPYNEDGRPPTIMFWIVNPTVVFDGSRINVHGLELPNLAWAGKIQQPYHRCPLCKNVEYMSDQMKKLVHRLSFDDLHRQCVSLA